MGLSRSNSYPPSSRTPCPTSVPGLSVRCGLLHSMAATDPPSPESPHSISPRREPSPPRLPRREVRRPSRPMENEDSYFSGLAELERSGAACRSVASDWTPDTVVDEEEMDELGLAPLERQNGVDSSAHPAPRRVIEVRELFEGVRPARPISITLPPSRRSRGFSAPVGPGLKEIAVQRMSRDEYKSQVNEKALADLRGDGASWEGPHPLTDPEREVFQRQVDIFLDVIQEKDAEIRRLREKIRDLGSEGSGVMES